MRVLLRTAVNAGNTRLLCSLRLSHLKRCQGSEGLLLGNRRMRLLVTRFAVADTVEVSDRVWCCDVVRRWLHNF